MKAQVTYNEDGSVDTITLHTNIPKTFVNAKGETLLVFDQRSNEEHYGNGFREVVQPTFDANTHKRSNDLIEIEIEGIKKVTYEVEVLSEEEIQAKVDQYKATLQTRLNEVVSSSRRYAKAIVLGKTINDDLDYFEDVYTTKYEMCQVTYFDALLEMEAQAEGFKTLDEYKAYVIGRFEAGKAFFEQAKVMLEVFRKVCLAHFEQDNYSKAERKITSLDDLPEDISPAVFATEFQRILAL